MNSEQLKTKNSFILVSIKKKTTSFQRNKAFLKSYNHLPACVFCLQMVWENGCVVIVMLTPLVESGVKQCYHYWPDEGSNLYHIYEVKETQRRSVIIFCHIYIYWIQMSETCLDFCCEWERKSSHMLFKSAVYEGQPIRRKSSIRHWKVQNWPVSGLHQCQCTLNMII